MPFVLTNAGLLGLRPENSDFGVFISFEPGKLDPLVLSRNFRNKGRKVERQAQEIPTQGSTMDQVSVSIARSRSLRLSNILVDTALQSKVKGRRLNIHVKSLCA